MPKDNHKDGYLIENRRGIGIDRSSSCSQVNKLHKFPRHGKTKIIISSEFKWINLLMLFVCSVNDNSWYLFINYMICLPGRKFIMVGFF